MQVFINSKLITGAFAPAPTILQLCAFVGVYLPRFCYHDELPIAANCRMCLVQIDDSQKPVASCAINVYGGLKVQTESNLIKQAREAVLEFLLINHPLDCPICDQGGECDLQDQTMVFGSDRGRFYEAKRAVSDFNLGPIVKTQMTRCIHCTRCVRFIQQLLYTETLGVIGRGSNMRISNLVHKPLLSGLSGNLADICPVGALTSKPYAFSARPWELSHYYSIDVSDAVCSPIRVDVRGVEIMRILPAVVGGHEWITDKARHSFDGLARQRLAVPLLNLDHTIATHGTGLPIKLNFSGAFFFLRKLFLNSMISSELQFATIGIKSPVNFYFGSAMDLNSLAVLKWLAALISDKFSFRIFDEAGSRIDYNTVGTFRTEFFVPAVITDNGVLVLLGSDIAKENSLLLLKIFKDRLVEMFGQSVKSASSRSMSKSCGVSLKNFQWMPLIQNTGGGAIIGHALVSRLDFANGYQRFFSVVENELSAKGIHLLAAASFLPNFLELGFGPLVGHGRSSLTSCQL